MKAKRSPSQSKPFRNSKIFRALGHPNRLDLISRLVECGRPCRVSEMKECCPIDFSVVSRHLGILREAGILKSEKKGKEVYYSIATENIVPNLRAIANAIEKCCCGKKGK